MRTKLKKLSWEVFYLLLGVGLASIGLKAFLLPNGFLDGGVTGLAILGKILFDWNVSLLLAALSLPFLILGYITVSKRIVFKSIFSLLLLAAAIELEYFPTITEDKLLISIFGGLFVGAGIGVSIRNGAVLDGSEILGIYINDRWGISIGSIILGFNVILFSITAFVVSVEVAMYSILTYLVTAQVTDLVIKGFEDFIGVTIVSRRHEILREAIIEELGVGVTLYQGSGGYGKTGEMASISIIHSVVNRIDIRKIYRIVDDLDPDAFVIEFDVNHVRGGILRHYFQRRSTSATGVPAL
jgi:uncharacterized membrane-anchored protein YitT (DUF2179 family)